MKPLSPRRPLGGRLGMAMLLLLLLAPITTASTQPRQLFPTPPPVNLGEVQTFSWTNTGSHYVVGTTTTPFLHYHRVDEDIITPITGFTAPSNVVEGTDWRFDDQFLLVTVRGNLPGILLYRQQGEVLSLVQQINLPGNANRGAEWSPNGQFAVVTHEASPFMDVYSFSGGVLTKLSDPASLPNAVCLDVDWRDSTHFVVGCNQSPWIFAYKIEVGVVVRETSAEPSVTPTAAVRSLSWDANRTHLAFGTGTAPRLGVYTWDGATLTRIADANITSITTSRVNDVTWSPDGALLTVAADNPAGFIPYDVFADDTFVQFAHPLLLQPCVIWTAEWSPNGTYTGIGDQCQTSNDGSPPFSNIVIAVWDPPHGGGEAPGDPIQDTLVPPLGTTLGGENGLIYGRPSFGSEGPSGGIISARDTTAAILGTPPEAVDVMLVALFLVIGGVGAGALFGRRASSGGVLVGGILSLTFGLFQIWMILLVIVVMVATFLLVGRGD